MPRYYVELNDRELGFEISQAGGVTHLLPLADDGGSDGVAVDFVPVNANVETGEGLYSLIANARSYQLYVERHDEHYRVMIWRHRYEVKVHTEREWRLMKVAPKQVAHSGSMVINAPMPGLVKAVLVEAGAEVDAGTRLVVLEAMKMENEITAPRGGRVGRVHIQAGSVVDAGKPLVTLE
jgi:biotin carboxyl carrier protein